MKKTENHFNNIGISSEPDMPRIRHLMKIGLAAAVMVLIGDMLLGYGTADAAVSDIPAAFARYLTVSDGRIFWAAILGLIGIPLECLCYFAVYRLIACKSEKYAHIYRTGIFGCLVFGGCGIHVPCCAAVYFMKKMVIYSPDTAFEMTAGFLARFLVPAMVLFLFFFFLLTVTQIKAFAKGLTLLPKWAWVFSVLAGLMMAMVLKIPNLPLTNALATGWISIGNIWMFGGLLLITKKKDKQHLPMMGVGPIYVAVIIAMTVAAVIAGRSTAFEKGRVPCLKIPLLVTGVLLIVLGVYLWAGAMFRSKIDSHIAQNRLAVTGVYALVRNPIYSAFMFFCTGALMIAGNLFFLPLFFLYWIFMAVLMKCTEERWLKNLYGREYEEYFRTVNRCIPCPQKSGN